MTAWGCVVGIIILATRGFYGLKGEITQTVSPARKGLAQEYYDHGRLLVDEHLQLLDSIPFFRAATRLNPFEFQYWLGLGVAELEVGDHQTSRQRFRKALNLNSMCEECKSYLTAISLYSAAVQGSVNHSGILNGFLLPLQEVQFQSKSQLLFDHSKPAVIRNIGKLWNLTSIQPRMLSMRFGSELTESYPQNMRMKPSRFYTMSVQEALQFIEFPKSAFASVDASSPGMYVQWNMNRTLFEQIISLVPVTNTEVAASEVSVSDTGVLTRTPSLAAMEYFLGFPSVAQLFDACFGSELLSEKFLIAMHWYMMTFGERNAGMFFHEDKLPTSSWQLQTMGKKSWKLCPPVEEATTSELLSLIRSARPDVRELQGTVTDYLDNISGPERVKLESLAYDIFRSADLFEGCDADNVENCSSRINYDYLEPLACYESVVAAGDVIYYPAGWWHQTLNLDDLNVAISSSLLSRRDLDNFIAEIKRECENVVDIDQAVTAKRYLQLSPNYQFSPQFCSLLSENCVVHWAGLENF
jgi:hypothetical protein